MNYQRIYDSIIHNASIRDLSEGLYYERHHIQPKSLGGSNKKENLVYLTGREHFICHLLLVKIHKNNTNDFKKMVHAFMLMSHQTRYMNSLLYENIKTEYSKIRSVARKDVPLTKDHKMAISKAMKGHLTSDETRKKISDKAKTRKRKPFSEEYKQRHSEIMKKKHRWKNAG